MEDTSYIRVSLQDLLLFEQVVARKQLLPDKRVHALLAGSHASKLRGRGLDFEEVRAYVPGDDIRTIDWRVTARTQKTHTKVFNEEKERPAFTVLDQTSYLFFGSQCYMKSVIAAQCAALSGFRILQKGDRFGGIVFNEKKLEFFTPKRSRSAVIGYLKAASDMNMALLKRKLNADNGPFLTEALRKTHRHVTHDYIITILSDFSGMEDKGFELIKQMSVHNDVILVQISDPMDRLSHKEMGLLSDGDAQFNLKAKKTEVEKREQQAASLEARFTDLYRKYRVPIVHLNGASSMEQQLKSIIQQKIG